MYELRQYQEDGVEAGIQFINSKYDAKKGIIVAPTGSGKSLYAAGIANRVESPLIVLQPSKELLEQNYEKYTSYGNEASIFSASLKSREVGHVTFATIGSIKKEWQKFQELGVKVVLIDECHIGSAGNGMLNKFIKQLGKVKVVGLTATPIILMSTLDEGPMLKMMNRTRKSFFNHILHITQIKDIIEQGFWADLVYDQLDLDTSKLEYNVSRSEFTEESQQRVYEENRIEDKIINLVQELRDRESILIFVPTVAAAQELSKYISDSEPVWGNMDSKKRAQVIQDFKNKTLRVVINVNVLAIGFDHPALDCVIDASATASFGRYYQKLGRACRPHPDKENALIVDASGNFGRFGELKNVTFEEYGDIGWGMFAGNQLLTGVSLDNSAPIYKTPIAARDDGKVIKFNFGKHANKPVSEAPTSYLNWLMTDFQWKPWNMEIKKEVERILTHKQFV